MPRQRKTIDVYDVQGHYGPHGWETVCSEHSLYEARQRLREYRANQPQYQHRLKKHREPKANYTPEQLADIQREVDQAPPRIAPECPQNASGCENDSRAT